MFQTPAQKITTYLKENGIKQNFISKKTGIKENALSSKLNGQTKLTLDDIELICGALGKEPNDFMEPRIPSGG